MKSPGSELHPSDVESRRQKMRSALEKQLGDSPEPRSAPPIIPDHTLLQRIGCGAYGEVWLARNALGSLRAVKIIFRDRFHDDRPFQREFNGILKYEPLSRSHEGLVAVLHVGRNDAAGYFYYIMELADEVSPLEGNESLDSREGDFAARHHPQYRPRTLHSDLVKNRRVPPVLAAQISLRLATALAHLHKNGLVHRDIKPSNVIFVGGQPKLADIGLITTLGDTQSFVGTEGFIPPEGPGAPQADLYALGKLLYEMVTGADRMDFPQLSADLVKQSEGEAVFELNEIITRACAPEKGSRYPTATEFIADLNLFLAGRSLREARRLEQTVAWLRRFAGIVCCGLVLAGLTVWVSKNQVRKAREREQMSRESARLESFLRLRAEAAELESRQQLYAALLEQARATVRSGALGQRVQALEAIRRAAAISNSFELRSVAIAALALPDLRLKTEIPLGQEFTAFQLDPAFRRIALCRGTNPVEILSVPGFQTLASLPASTNARVYIINWSPDGRYLAVKRDVANTGLNSDLEVWDVEKSRRLLLTHDVSFGTFSFSPVRSQVLVGKTGGEVMLWDLDTGSILKQYRFPKEVVFLSFSPEGTRFAVAFGSDRHWLASIRTIEEGTELSSWKASEQPACLNWHPKEDLLLEADHGGWVTLLDLRTHTSRPLGRHKAQAVIAAFCGQGDYAITGGWERELICWDVRGARQAFAIGLNSFTAQFRNDGRECAIGTSSGLKLYSLELPDYEAEVGQDLGGRLWSGTFSPDGRWLAVPGQEKLGVWDLVNRGPPALHQEAAGARLFFSQDSRELFASRDDTCLGFKLVPASAKNEPPVLQNIHLQVPADFSSLCVVSNQLVLTLTNGSLLVTSQNFAPAGTPVSPTSDGVSGTSPDGRWLAIYRPYSLVLNIYHLPSLEPAFVLTNSGSIHAFEFSPDGQELAVASSRRLEFWDTSKWRCLRSVGNFMDVLFSDRHGPWWMTKDYQNGGLYEAASFAPVLPLPPGMLPLALTQDGKRLAVSVDSRRVQVWNLERLHRQFRELGIDWRTLD